MTAWANFVVAGGNGCTCCNAVAPNCFLTLPTPIGAVPYGDLTEATDAISDTDNCTAFFYTPYILGSTQIAYQSGSNVFINGFARTGVPPGLSVSIQEWCSLELEADSVLTVNYALSTDFASVPGITLELYDLDGAIVDSNSASTSTGALGLVAPSTNCFSLLVSSAYAVVTPDTDNGIHANVRISSNGNIAVGGIRANYDDGGGTSFLVCS